MVTTTDYDDSINRAWPDEGYDGVVRIIYGGYYGTGVLLYDGKAVLTAAHLFDFLSATQASIRFETLAGVQTVTADDIAINPAYDPDNDNNDLALVWLSESAPEDADRYSIYRESDEIGKSFTMVGYGMSGTGTTGAIINNYSADPVRWKAENRFDADVGMLTASLGSVMAWEPAAGTQLIADFDNGTWMQDALGRLIDCVDTGLENNTEGLIAPGDSGGPAFIDGQLAGIATCTASLQRGDIDSDIDSLGNSSYGEVGFWQRVSNYQQWIDESIRAQYPGAPSSPEEVQKSVTEGDSGTSYAYFLLQFTGVRSDPDQWLSVDYTTRNGTAEAGNDYLAVSGKLVLYPGENEAVIPVEIVGDNLIEPDEYFYMDVTNPVGGSFGTGVIQLTAMRTILNDDGSC